MARAPTGPCRAERGEVMDQDEFKPTVKLTPEQEAARNKRNGAIAFGLVAFVVLIFITTVVQMTSNWNAGAAG